MRAVEIFGHWAISAQGTMAPSLVGTILSGA